MQEINHTSSIGRQDPQPSSQEGIRTGNIVFLILGWAKGENIESMYRLPSFPALLAGIQMGVSVHKYNLVLAQYDGGPIPLALSPEKTDGILIHGALNPMPMALRAALLNVPSVWLMRQHSDFLNDFDHVFYDNQAVGPLAARYFLGRNHRHVAFIMPEFGQQAFMIRRDKFVEAVNAGGGRCTVWNFSAAESGSSLSLGLSRVMGELVASNDRPTAMFVPSDNHMLEVFNALKLNGIEPCREIDLLGCNNDVMFLSKMNPRPATIDIKLNLVGYRGVEQLLTRMKHPEESSRTQVFISPVLVRGEV